MNLLCKRLSLLLFMSLVVNTGSAKLFLAQNLMGGSHITILTSASLKTDKTSLSLPDGDAKHTDAGFGSRQKNSSSQRTLQGDDVHRFSSFSNTSLTTSANRSGKWRTMFDFLKHVLFFSNIHGKASNQTQTSSSLSALPSSTPLSAGTGEVPHENFPLVMPATSAVSPVKTGPKTFKTRGRRGAFPLVPDNYAERQSYFSPTETCRQRDLVRVLRPPGCLRRAVRTSSCEGTCHSRSVPDWDIDLQQLRHVAYCTCCKPHQLSYRRTRFRCPGRPRRVLVVYVGVATECACRPCSEASPAPQQPYDY